MNVLPLTLDMMKAIRTILVLALLLMVTTAQAQCGSWKGELDVQGIKLPLVFHFTDKGCTMDSPAQNVRGIPTQTVVKGDSVTVEIAMIGARFEGVNKGTEIVGTFTQQGIAFPLTLTPGEVTLNRPQTPKPPFDYLTEEVSFTNGSFTLRGTLTKPRGCSRQTPVVLMVSGSGQQNRDEELFGHKPFAVLADALARQGIASLRYDDRGWGDASVRFYEFTTADFYADALSGLALLRKQFDRVGMLGHSEGGTIALMAAAEGKTDFIVTLAAMAVSGKETMIAQNRSVLTAAGTTPEMTEAYCMAIGCALDQLAQGKKTADIKPTGVPVLFRSVFDKALKQGDSPYIRHRCERRVGQDCLSRAGTQRQPRHPGGLCRQSRSAGERARQQSPYPQNLRRTEPSLPDLPHRTGRGVSADRGDHRPDGDGNHNVVDKKPVERQ